METCVSSSVVGWLPTLEGYMETIFHFEIFIHGGPSNLKSVLQGAMVKTNYNDTYKEAYIYIQLNEILYNNIIYRTK